MLKAVVELSAKQTLHVDVRHLSEILVPDADRRKMLRRMQTHDLGYVPPEFIENLTGRDGYRNNNTLRLL